MSKKINMQVAMMEYYDETDRMNEVVDESVKSADFLWDAWYVLAFMYEPDIQEKFKVDEQDDEEIFTDRPMEDRKSKHRLRRQSTFFHKHRLKRIANVVIKNYNKRFEHDCHDQKRHIRGETVLLESRSVKSEQIIKRAAKIKAPNISKSKVA